MQGIKNIINADVNTIQIGCSILNNLSAQFSWEVYLKNIIIYSIY